MSSSGESKSATGIPADTARLRQELMNLSQRIRKEDERERPPPQGQLVLQGK